MTYILHDALGLFDLADKVVLFSLNLSTGFLTQCSLVVRVEAAALNLALLGCLGAVEHETAVLNIATSLGGELNVGVESCLPAS